MQGEAVSSYRGKAGEDYVYEYLKKSRYEIVTRNFRIKGGEIDIIALKGDEIVFCEVKTRKFGAMENGAAAMNKAKMKRIIKAAERFIRENPRYDNYFRRFDTAYVTVTSEKIPSVLDIEYYEGDFTALDLE